MYGIVELFDTGEANAAQKGKIKEGDLGEYKTRDQGRQAAETSGCHSPAQRRCTQEKGQEKIGSLEKVFLAEALEQARIARINFYGRTLHSWLERPIRRGLKNIGTRIRDARLEAIITVRSLAHALSSDEKYINDAEAGANPFLSFVDLIDIARELDVSIEWLLAGKKEEG